MPEFKDEIIPFAQLGLDLEVDYAVIKHCSDDTEGTLGVDYSKYKELTETLVKAEGAKKAAHSTAKHAFVRALHDHYVGKE